jgi:hypothetical protein
MISQLFLYEKEQPRTGRGEMVRVACTHPVNPSRTNDAGRWSTVLSGGVGPGLVLEDLSEG